MITKEEVLAIINLNLEPGTNITAEEHIAVEEALLDFAESQWLTGDIKEIDCTQEYIDANFITSGNTKGLGIGERAGWAICNGFNLTKNRTGRVSVGWGNVDPLDYATTSISSYPNIGTNSNNPVRGGSEKHVLDVLELPVHNHIFPGDDQLSAANGLSGWTNRTTANFNYDATSKTGNGKMYRTTDTGSGLPHNSMQPYIVTLFIQKL
jgi:hypothetical protein